VLALQALAGGRLEGGEAEAGALVAADDPFDGGVADVADAVEEDDGVGRCAVAQDTCSIGAPAAFQPLNPTSR